MSANVKNIPKRIRQRSRPGELKDAIVATLAARPSGATLAEIERDVHQLMGATPRTSIRLYLQSDRESLFEQSQPGMYSLRAQRLQSCFSGAASAPFVASFVFGKASLFQADCFDWLRQQPANSVHAIVTDPPYGLIEYDEHQQQKLRAGKGGVWRIPPAFDGIKRAPLPRFTVLKPIELEQLTEFFFEFGRAVLPVLVPGANVVIASNPLLSYLIAGALARAGLERRGEIARLVMTMRGGDRPKAAHREFADVSVMPRSMWEPWLTFRKPIEGRIQDNLRQWRTGGFRRPSADRPFGDVISSAPTHKSERNLAPHPSLKPQAFLRTLVRGVLPLGEGMVLDPFAGSGSTLAAAEAVGYRSIGVERDRHYIDMAIQAMPLLSRLKSR